MEQAVIKEVEVGALLVPEVHREISRSNIQKVEQGKLGGHEPVTEHLRGVFQDIARFTAIT